MSSAEIDLERVLCRLEELRATGCREFRLGGGDWPLKGFVLDLGPAGGAAAGVRAYVNRCPHRALPLNLLPDRFLSHDGTMIVCCMHGALFEKATGFCVAGPCVGGSLKPIPVCVIDGLVLLAESTEQARSR
jgi:nitrite reductase/ring-hydroxylating ferredoxin subunit